MAKLWNSLPVQIGQKTLAPGLFVLLFVRLLVHFSECLNEHIQWSLVIVIFNMIWKKYMQKYVIRSIKVLMMVLCLQEHNQKSLKITSYYL